MRKNTDPLAEILIGSLHDVTVTYLREGRSPSSLPRHAVRYIAETKVPGALITIVRHRRCREMEMLSGDVTLVCSIVLPEEDEYMYTACCIASYKVTPRGLAGRSKFINIAVDSFSDTN